ncbi:MAG: hypothetical protein ACFCVB_03950 [Nodosilinea sp.]
MVEDPGLANGFKLSIKSLESGLDPKVIHAAVQVLRSSISALSELEQTPFSFFYGSQQPTDNLLAAKTPGETMYTELQFEAPLDKLTVVLRCVGDWLERTKQKSLFAIAIPPAYNLTLQTDQAKVLAQLLPLGEALLPPQDVYLAKAETYIDIFGDFTPAARANLAIMCHRLGLSREVADDLNAQSMGPFKTLTEKYQHFRKELLACKQEIALDGDFWQVMEDKAATMSLPKADAEFLKAERLHALRTEAEQVRQQSEATAEAERQRQRQQQQRLANYRQTFIDVVMGNLTPQSSALDAATFRQGLMAHLSATEFSRGRLTQAREFYHLSQPEVEVLEQAVLDELYLLSGLL